MSTVQVSLDFQKLTVRHFTFTIDRLIRTCSHSKRTFTFTKKAKSEKSIWCLFRSEPLQRQHKCEAITVALPSSFLKSYTQHQAHIVFNCVCGYLCFISIHASVRKTCLEVSDKSKRGYFLAYKYSKCFWLWL